MKCCVRACKGCSAHSLQWMLHFRRFSLITDIFPRPLSARMVCQPRKTGGWVRWFYSPGISDHCGQATMVQPLSQQTTKEAVILRNPAALRLGGPALIHPVLGARSLNSCALGMFLQNAWEAASVRSVAAPGLWLQTRPRLWENSFSLRWAGVNRVRTSFPPSFPRMPSDILGSAVNRGRLLMFLLLISRLPDLSSKFRP